MTTQVRDVQGSSGTRLNTLGYWPGKSYDLSRILYPNATFNEAAYKEYSPLYLSYVRLPLRAAARLKSRR